LSVLILASSSPRRRDLLEAAGIRFRAVPPDIEEPGPSSICRRCADLVRRTALAKASSVARREPGVVLGADTIVVCEGRVMGKPADAADAGEMLRLLSGRWHSVYTGVALVCGRDTLVGYERTQVRFRGLSNRDISHYIGSGEPMDKAGAYAIQARGAALVRAIRGCYTNVVGLPVPKLMEMLAEFEARSPDVRALLKD
jgi:septum formation protein